MWRDLRLSLLLSLLFIYSLTAATSSAATSSAATRSAATRSAATRGSSSSAATLGSSSGAATSGAVTLGSSSGAATSGAATGEIASHNNSPLSSFFKAIEHKLPTPQSFSRDTQTETIDGKRLLVKSYSIQLVSLGQSWEAEIATSRLAHQIGISPALLSLDSNRARLLFEPIQDLEELHFDKNSIQQLAKELLLLHQTSIALTPFQPSKAMEHFLQQIERATSEWSERIQKGLKLTQEIQQTYEYSCHSPCHLNLCRETLSQSHSKPKNNSAIKLWITDWGFASMADPAYELANLCALEQLPFELQKQLLQSYYGSLSAKIWARHCSYIAISYWYWSAWLARRADLYGDEKSQRLSFEYLSLAEKAYAAAQTPLPSTLLISNTAYK